MKNSDIFIMIPVTGKLHISDIIKNNKTDSECVKFYNELDKYITYACKDIVKNTLKRTVLGIYKFKYFVNDQYAKGKHELIDCFISLCYQDATQLGILEIIFKHFKDEDSQVAAIFHTDNAIFINDDFNANYDISLNDFLQNLNLEKSGNYRVLSQNSSKNSSKKLKYLLSGETAKRQHNYFDIENDFVKNNFKDLLEYDTYYLYASDKAVIQLIDNYKNNFKDNIDDEIMPFYLLEFTILQNSALYRMNSAITTKIKSNGKITSKETLKLIEDFGKTIILWDKNIYKYYFDQKVANSLSEAFNTPDLRNEYNNNKKHIDQLTSLKKNLDDNVANTLLGAITFLFTLINLYEIVINFNEYISNPSALTISFSLIYIAWISFLLYKHRSY